MSCAFEACMNFDLKLCKIVFKQCGNIDKYGHGVTGTKKKKVTAENCKTVSWIYTGRINANKTKHGHIRSQDSSLV
jgi:hypothetical protein